MNFRTWFSWKNDLPSGKVDIFSYPGLSKSSRNLYLTKSYRKSTRSRQKDLEWSFFPGLGKRQKAKSHNFSKLHPYWTNFFLLEAQVNERKDCQISYPVRALNKNGAIKREGGSKSHIDVICNILSGGKIRGNLASANSTSNNIDSPCIRVVHGINQTCNDQIS